MKSPEIAKMTNALCKDLENAGAGHQFVVDFVGHFRALLKYLERKPDRFTVEGESPFQTMKLHWITPSGELTVTVQELPF